MIKQSPMKFPERKYFKKVLEEIIIIATLVNSTHQELIKHLEMVMTILEFALHVQFLTHMEIIVIDFIYQKG